MIRLLKSLAIACTLLWISVPRIAAGTVPPRIFFVDVEAGPIAGGPNNLGVPISIFGKRFGTARGSSKVMIGKLEVASYLVWGTGNAHNPDLDMIVVQPGRISGGAITVIVDGANSNSDFGFTPTQGKIYYVAPTGPDAKACTEAAPCATITNAVGKMKPGDAVLLRQGIYTERETWIRVQQGGMAGRPVTIKAYPQEEVILNNAGRDFYIDADHVTVSGLNFRNGKALLTTGWASLNQRDNKFFNNTFTGTIAWAAIEMTGHDHIIAGNVCDISGSTVGTMGHCFYVTQGTNLKIVHNVASGAPGYGLHIYDERRADKDMQRVIRDVLVEGNALKGSRQRSGMVLDMTDAGSYGNRIENVTIRNNVFSGNNHSGVMIKGSVRGISVYNNTFYQNGRQAIYVDDDAKINGVDIRNNLFYQSENSNCSVECGMPKAHVQIGSHARGVSVQGNSYHPGKPVILGSSDRNAVVGSVSFANGAGGDFHIGAGSAEVLQGAVIPDVQFDFEGKSRPQDARYDIGAFQH